MARFWTTASTLVLGIAALKTTLVVQFAVPGAEPGTIATLFGFFTAMTAGVGALAWRAFGKRVSDQRRKRLAPGAAAPVAKETVIARHAHDWGLSQAEADVAIFVAKGFSNNEIADMRGCALATVKSQLTKIYQKSGLETRYQLMAFVTDEVVSMAREQEAAERPQIRKILPLVGRNRADATPATAIAASR